MIDYVFRLKGRLIKTSEMRAARVEDNLVFFSLSKTVRVPQMLVLENNDTSGDEDDDQYHDKNGDKDDTKYGNKVDDKVDDNDDKDGD